MANGEWANQRMANGEWANQRMANGEWAIRGSHHIYRRPGSPPITVARHGAHVHSAAVREVLRIIDEMTEDS